MQLLSAPIYFKLAEVEKGTVLVEDGTWTKEQVSEKYGNLQHYFTDKSDGKLKCISGGSANYLIDTYDLRDGKRVKITYDGTSTMENGKFAGKEAHQFKFEAIEDVNAEAIKEVQDAMQETNKDIDLNDLA